MRGFNFPPTTTTSDWRAPFYIAASGTNYVPEVLPKDGSRKATNPPTLEGVTATALVTWHPPDDEVILGMSGDTQAWEDYGSHRTSYPPGKLTPPFFQASSNDGSGYVALINPGLIDILIPASVMRGFGVGEINVGLRYARASDQRTSTLFVGRLPIIHGVV
jgi:hypothetical protein